jgi:hypothetical protein
MAENHSRSKRDRQQPGKEASIAWAHQTIRYCLMVYARDAGKGEPSQTAALALAHDLWDKAVSESGQHPADTALIYARLVLDWCALYRSGEA